MDAEIPMKKIPEDKELRKYCKMRIFGLKYWWDIYFLKQKESNTNQTNF